MSKKFKVDENDKFFQYACRIHYKSRKCKTCKKYIKSNKNMGKLLKKNVQLSDISPKTLKRHFKISERCDKCAETNAKKCTPKQSLAYSKWFYGEK